MKRVGTGDAEHQHQTSESGVRTTGRIKKPKTVFDPSDNYLSRAQRSASAIAASVAVLKHDHHTTPTMSTPTKATPTMSNPTVSNPTMSSPTTSTATLSSLSNATATSFNNTLTGSSDSINDIANNIAGDTSPVVVNYGKGFDTCMKCLKTEPRRGQGFKSKFLQCRTCTKKWHINCIKIQFECYRLARDKYKCENCRKCCVCSRNKNVQTLPKNRELIVCTFCVDAYHVDCHKPNVLKSQVFDGSFMCSKCEFVPPDNMGVKTKKDSSKRPITPNARSFSQSSDKSISSLEFPITSLALPSEVQPTAPVEQVVRKLATDTASIKKWSVDDVVYFFKQHHPEEYAEVFKTHEIDGAALLLLKRSQVLKRFNLKVGPKLRLYESIVVLQTQEDNIMNSWND